METLKNHSQNPSSGWLTNREIGDYRLAERVGTGQFASVYRAIQKTTKQEVAIKILKPSLLENQEILLRFQREVEALKTIQHPGIIRFIDFHQDPEIGPYLITEYVQGTTLAQTIQNSPNLALEEMLEVAIQLCLAVDCAHKLSIVHRDLKPENIQCYFDEEKQPHIKLLDFGIVYLEQEDSNLTGVRFMGTPNYMAPEQFDGILQAPSLDIYALGVIFYEMLVGSPPFSGKNFREVGLDHLLKPVPPIQRNIPEELKTLIYSLLAKNPESRPHELLDLARRLHHFIQGEERFLRNEYRFKEHQQLVTDEMVTRIGSIFDTIRPSEQTYFSSFPGSESDISEDTFDLKPRISDGKSHAKESYDTSQDIEKTIQVASPITEDFFVTVPVESLRSSRKSPVKSSQVSQKKANIQERDGLETRREKALPNPHDSSPPETMDSSPPSEQQSSLFRRSLRFFRKASPRERRFIYALWISTLVTMLIIFIWILQNMKG